MKNALHGLALAAFCALSTPALAATDAATAAATSLHGNGLHLNALSINGLRANGLQLNGLGLNGVHLHRARADGATLALQKAAADSIDAEHPVDQLLHRLARSALLK